MFKPYAGIWWNWRAGNHICISNDIFPLFNFRREVISLATAIEGLYRNSGLEPNIPIWITRHFSRENCFVLNVDGSSIGNLGPSTIGGLIRSATGEWLRGFARYIDRRDNLYVEFMTLHRGLLLA